MDDLVGGLIEAAGKFLAMLTLCLLVPVLAIWALVKGVVWLISNYWPYMVGAVVLLVLLAIVIAAFKAWLDFYEARASKRQALRQLDAAFQQASTRMEDIARHNPGNGSGSAVVPTK